MRIVFRLNPMDPFTFLGKKERRWHATLSVTYVMKKHEFMKKIKLQYSESRIYIFIVRSGHFRSLFLFPLGSFSLYSLL